VITDDKFTQIYESFRNDLNSLPGIVMASGCLWGPPTNNTASMEIPRIDNPNERAVLEAAFIDFDFIETLQFEVAAGRIFSSNLTTDSSVVMINESALAELGVEDPIGEKTVFGEIIGVVNDFHMKSLHSKIRPMIFLIMTNTFKQVIVRVDSKANTSDVIESIKRKYLEYSPDATIEVRFFEESLRNLYLEEIRFNNILTVFTLLAIFIACLGLFGLSLFVATRRTKEIGIRKVYGASMGKIVWLISREFLFIVLISNLIAWPLGWYFMEKWLRNFAYRISIEWWIFVFVAVLSATMVFIAIIYQSLRAANTDPVKSLRYE